LDAKGKPQIQNHSSRDEILRKTTKYMLFDHKINHDILKDLKTQPVLEKGSNYKTKWIHVHRMNGSRLTQAVMKHKPARKRNTEYSFNRLVILRLESATRPKSLKA
jgi:hypothetical protein